MFLFILVGSGSSRFGDPTQVAVVSSSVPGGFRGYRSGDTWGWGWAASEQTPGTHALTAHAQ